MAVGALILFGWGGGRRPTEQYPQVVFLLVLSMYIFISMSIYMNASLDSSLPRLKNRIWV